MASMNTVTALYVWIDPVIEHFDTAKDELTTLSPLKELTDPELAKAYRCEKACRFRTLYRYLTEVGIPYYQIDQKFTR